MAPVIEPTAAGITAPALLGMDSRGARVVGAMIVVAMVTSILTAGDRFRSLPLLSLSMAIAAAGVAGILTVRADPMRRRDAWMIGCTGPAACALTLVDLPGPMISADQTNVLGVGVIVCAFLSVRGQAGVAWTSLSLMIAQFGGWGLLTGQGALAGLSVAVPNIAILGMSTLFAVTIRPAAAEIRRLRTSAMTEAATLAAERARRLERHQRRTELRESAWPALTTIASGASFSPAESAELNLLAAQLRDGVRAKVLKVPAVVAEARDARARGVTVVMFDDGAMNDVAAEVRADFCELAREWLHRTADGTITLRVHPTGRGLLGSIVVERRDGTEDCVEVYADADTNRSESL